MQPIAWLTTGCLLLQACQGTKTEPLEAGPAPDRGTPGTASADPSTLPESIGSASMAPDGIITLHLRATGGGAVGDGMVVYRPSDPKYREVLDHLGGMKPGETKPVPPWK